MKKRILSLFLVLMVLLSACGTLEKGSGSAPDGSQLQESISSQPSPGDVESSSDGTDSAGESPHPTQTQSQPDEESGDDASDILDAAYALSPGEALPGTFTLSGTVSAILNEYSSRYDNITLLLTVPGHEDCPVQCFRLEGEGVAWLAEGDVITVSGRLMNYKGTVEFDEGCQLVSYTLNHPVEESQPPQTGAANDDSRDAVALYIHENGCLPDFYLTKSQARSRYNWTGGPLDKLAPGLCIGGDTFTNYQKVLPDAPGRRWTECDIDTIGKSARGAKRIVFSNDGLIYYTDDHYETFTLLYGEP